MAKSEDREKFSALCERLGVAMMIWQNVELAHFKLFLKMLGAPRREICSTVYFSIESFEARHKMVGRMAHFFLEGPHYADQRREWSGADGGLTKLIKDANENRNKLAHYGLEYPVLAMTEKPDGSLDIEFGDPRLQPAQENQVSKLLGRTPDRPEHSLSVEELKSYCGQFAGLAFRINKFQESLDLPPPQQGLGILGNLMRLGDEQSQSHQSPAIPTPKGDKPSGA